MMSATEIKQNPYIAVTDKGFATLLAADKGLPSWFAEVRKRAYEVFKLDGFPSRKSENYRYTYLEPFFTENYKIPEGPSKTNIATEEIFRCDVPELNTHLILLINGYYHGKELLKTLPNGVVMGSLREAIKTQAAIVKKHYGKYSSLLNDPFAELNLALSSDGFFMYVPEGVKFETPIQIINIALNDSEQFISNHNLIVVEKGGLARVVVCDHSLSPQKFIMNSATEIFAGTGSNVEFYKLQNSHNNSVQISTVAVSQEAESNVINNYITLHGGLIRNNLLVALNGKHAHNDSSGILLADKMQLIDNFIHVQHQSPDCESKQLFRGILDDLATGIFSGKILVAKDAQRTQAYQENNNILLSNEAKARTKPQLEIYADDVKCSHGATVGQLDKEAFFYLRSRGIPEKEARLILLHAFAHKVLEKITVAPLRERYDELINKRLRGEFSRCNNCSVKCTK
jgi:Fe-S cluster assembly protein SufD